MLHKYNKYMERFTSFNYQTSLQRLFLLKIATIFIAVIVIYGTYLDRKIKNYINEKTWKIPAELYGHIVSLKPNMLISQKEIIKFLEVSRYHQVKKVMSMPGEFINRKKSIEIIRRSFSFPDKYEDKAHVCFIFSDNYLKIIKNIQNNCQFNFFRLDPPLITTLSFSDREHRLFMKRDDFPKTLVDILLAIEDRRFYTHEGINFYSIGRAILANISARKPVQGASTLTQQLIKNFFLTSKRSYWRKLNEVYMALLMDARYSKDQILELYMNEVYLGQNGDKEIRGFPLASLCYFGRSVSELSIDQQALLVGMVKGASIYNPWRNPKLALNRRNLVLRLLTHQKIINKKLYDVLKIRPLSIQPRDRMISPQSPFVQMVRQELNNKLTNKIKDLSGVKIFTTFDSISQDSAEKAVVEGIPFLKKEYNLQDLETAIVVVDRYNGEIRAIVGGSGPQYIGYNRATQARRSIGSLAKPATYLTALSQPNKYKLNTWISDEPLTLYQSNGIIWSPKNDNHHFSGHVMLIDALTRSMNVPTVNLGMTLGLSAITDTWQKLGISKDRLHPVPAMILGALNLTPIEVAQAFQTIANEGKRVSLSLLCSVITRDGKILLKHYPKEKRTFPKQVGYIMLWAMQKVIQHGTGQKLGEKYPYLHLAGKTGTTNNNIDTWFAGIDGREVLIIWVGRDNNQPTKLYGANGAMSIYQRYLVNRSPVPLKLIPPKNIIDINIDEVGNFICKNKGDKIPVWTTNLSKLCQSK